MVISGEAMGAWRAFLEAHAGIVRKLEHELREECDFPLSWYDALVQLREAGGVLRMHELADNLLLSRSATTRFVDRLESADLITRSRAMSDRRGTEVELTEFGRAELARTAPIHLRGVSEHFAAKFDEADLRAISRLLGRLSDGS